MAPGQWQSPRAAGAVEPLIPTAFVTGGNVADGSRDDPKQKLKQL